MAQTGFTPIQLFQSSTPGAQPPTTDLVPGELALNTTDGKLYYLDSSSNLATLVWDVLPINRGGTGSGTGDSASLIGLPSPRVVSYLDINNVAFSTANTDILSIYTTLPAGTMTFNLPLFPPTDGRKVIIRFRSSFPQAFVWDPVFVANTTSVLPTVSSGAGLTDYFGFIYDADKSKWQMLAASYGF